MSSIKPKVKFPSSAKKGEIVEIKTQIQHDMETGQRKGSDGNLLPRRLINKFECLLNGKIVLSTKWHTAISANPYFSFFVKFDEGGKLELKWYDDNGEIHTAESNVSVS